MTTTPDDLRKLADDADLSSECTPGGTWIRDNRRFSVALRQAADALDTKDFRIDCLRLEHDEMAGRLEAALAALDGQTAQDISHLLNDTAIDLVGKLTTERDALLCERAQWAAVKENADRACAENERLRAELQAARAVVEAATKMRDCLDWIDKEDETVGYALDELDSNLRPALAAYNSAVQFETTLSAVMAETELELNLLAPTDTYAYEMDRLRGERDIWLAQVAQLEPERDALKAEVEQLRLELSEEHALYLIRTDERDEARAVVAAAKVARRVCMIDSQARDAFDQTLKGDDVWPSANTVE